MILLPFLKKGALLLALCGMLGGGVLSAQETGSVPITEAGLKALDSNVFTNDFMLALKPSVTRDRIAKSGSLRARARPPDGGEKI